ncbi:fumarate hydratase [Achromatium sp. WMS3]|nr:fumarate hydratase [Achromatium sp. WMS3]
MITIRQADLIQSIRDALQFISYYHPKDFIQALGEAYEQERSQAARDAIAQILVNSKMCAEGKRPICQDTGIAVIFLKIGMDVKWELDNTNENFSIEDMVNEGVRQAYTDPNNTLRASILQDPSGTRKNTKDNTPAVVHTSLVPGDTVEVIVAAKGGGSENKAKFAMLNPSDSIVDWILKTVPTMGAGWCPPGILGIGIGGTPEKAMLMAKEALMEPIDIHKIRSQDTNTNIEALRLELYNKINALGIGAQGLGGLTTVLDVKIKDYPTHAASLPVAMIPNCAATRHVEFTLDGRGPAEFIPPSLEIWPQITLETSTEAAKRVNLDTLDKAQIAAWRPGDRLLLSGKLLTGRDAAHKRIVELLERGETLPDGVDLKNRFIYYVGPVDPVRDEVVGPAGPTTATRMDKFTRYLLEKTGLIGMVGKAERGPAAIAAIKEFKAVYLIAVGGAAYLVSKAIRSARIVAFPELGMEAIREFEVVDMPVMVAVDSQGDSVHTSGPAKWQQIIATLNP